MASTDDILESETRNDDSADTSCVRTDFRSYTTAFGLGITQIALGICITSIWAVSVKESSLYVAPEGRFIAPGVLAVLAGSFGVAGAQAGRTKVRTGLTVVTFVFSLLACATAVYVCVIDGYKLGQYSDLAAPPLLIALESVSLLEVVMTVIQMVISGDAVWFGRQGPVYRRKALPCTVTDKDTTASGNAAKRMAQHVSSV